MKQIIVLLLLLPALLPAQNLSFGLRGDSTGIYFIQQKVSALGDSTQTIAVAIRFDTPQEALVAVQAWRNSISQDSATLQNLFRENARQRAELDRAAAQLHTMQTGAEKPEKSENPEQELARLRKENAELKRGKN